jgi:hypothetical protein
VIRLSTTLTKQPCETSLLQIFEPIKPAPPVTRNFSIKSALKKEIRLTGL